MGWVFLVFFFVLGIVYLIWELIFVFLDWNVFCIVIEEGIGFFDDERKFFFWMENNVYDELVSLLIIFSVGIVVFFGFV